MRILKEPLFHFFLLGVLIFVWFGVRNPDAMVEQAPDAIVFDSGDIERVIEQFEATWRRPPTEQELDRLLQGLVREEILVREATALGLDRNDSVIRSRLVQKMDFLTTSVAQAAIAEDADLIAHMEANPERFTTPAQVSFQQVLLNPDDSVEEVLATLNAGTAPENVSRTTLLPATIQATVQRGVNSIFGNGFFEQLADLPRETWSGPVRSGYGDHLVYVTDFVPGTLPAFEDARETVLNDWRREKREELSAAQFDVLKARYEISVPDAATAMFEAGNFAPLSGGISGDVIDALLTRD